MEFCNADKVGEDVHNKSDENSGEEPKISLGLEFHHHHSFKKTLSLSKTGKLENHSSMDVLFKRNTTLASRKNMLMVKRNIKESSDSLLMNLIKANLAEVEPVIFDISFS